MLIIQYTKNAFPQKIEEFLSRLKVRNDASFCTSDMVLAEVRSGLSEKDFQEVRVFLADLTYLACNAEISLFAGKLFYNLARRGETIPLANCLIAAVAEFYNGVVVTSDKRHFQKLEPSLPVLYL